MRLVWVLRIALVVQLLLGFERLIGTGGGRLVADLHLGLGLLIAVLAPIVFRPLPELPSMPIRRLARFAPLAPLFVGLGMRYGNFDRTIFIPLHVVLAFATIAIIEIAAARQRRALAART